MSMNNKSSSPSTFFENSYLSGAPFSQNRVRVCTVTSQKWVLVPRVTSCVWLSGYEVAQSNVAYLLDAGETQMFAHQEKYKRALLQWSRAAGQGQPSKHVNAREKEWDSGIREVCSVVRALWDSSVCYPLRSACYPLDPVCYPLRSVCYPLDPVCYPLRPMRYLLGKYAIH